MKIETAKLLVEALDNNGVESELRTDYIGRGMGKIETNAVVAVDISTVVESLVEYIINNVEESGDSGLATWNGRTDMRSGRIRMDNMGKGVVLY